MEFSADHKAFSYTFQTADSGCVVSRDVGITGVAEIILQANMQKRAAGQVALVAGAAGLVGREILATILADDANVTVHGVGRRALATTHLKLTLHILDFAVLPALPVVDDVFIALGTTIKVAGLPRFHTRSDQPLAHFERLA